MSTMGSTKHKVDIYWDFNTCPIPEGCSGYTVVNNIRLLALRIGHIRTFRTYMGPSDRDVPEAAGASRAVVLRSELQSSGVSITDVPEGGDSIYKILLVDMLIHSFDHTDSPGIIMLISSDGGLAYGISMLRMRGGRVAILGPELSGPKSKLSAQADLCLDWQGEILDPAQPPSTTVSSPAPQSHAPSSNTCTCGRALTQESTKVAPTSNGAESSPAEPMVTNSLEASSSASAIRTNATSSSESSQSQDDPALDDGPTPSCTAQIISTVSSISSQPGAAMRQSHGIQGGETCADRSAMTSSFTAWVESVQVTESVTMRETRPMNKPAQTRALDGKRAAVQPSALPVAKVAPSVNNTQSTSAISGFDSPEDNASEEVRSVGSLPSGYGMASPVPTPTFTFPTLNVSTTSNWRTRATPEAYQQLPASTPRRSEPTLDGTSTVEFKSLINVLNGLKTEAGLDKPLFGIVARHLKVEDPMFYEKSGTTKFSQYARLAAERGIVDIGGHGKSLWMSLRE